MLQTNRPTFAVCVQVLCLCTAENQVVGIMSPDYDFGVFHIPCSHVPEVFLVLALVTVNPCSSRMCSLLRAL